MLSLVQKLTVTSLAAATIVCLAQPTTAAPVVNAAAIKNAAPSNIETVRWRRWWAVPAGVAAGVVVGRALTAPYRYAPPAYYYGPPPAAYYPPPAAYYPPPAAYAAPGYAAPVPQSADAVAYCRQQFKSYDVRSGTYLGHDGQRHPCP
jgi:hypothetical protein